MGVVDEELSAILVNSESNGYVFSIDESSDGGGDKAK